MNVDTQEFARIRDLADEAAGLRRYLAYQEVLIQAVEKLAEERGFARGLAARRGSRPNPSARDGFRSGHLRLVGEGSAR